MNQRSATPCASACHPLKRPFCRLHRILHLFRFHSNVKYRQPPHEKSSALSPRSAVTSSLSFAREHNTFAPSSSLTSLSSFLQTLTEFRIYIVALGFATANFPQNTPEISLHGDRGHFAWAATTASVVTNCVKMPERIFYLPKSLHGTRHRYEDDRDFLIGRELVYGVPQTVEWLRGLCSDIEFGREWGMEIHFSTSINK